MILLDGDVALVGCGNMGSAMLAGWLESGVRPERMVVQEPAPSDELVALVSKQGVRVVDVLQASDFRSGTPAVVIMAVKPQLMDAVFSQLAPLLGADTLVISIAAGRTIASFEARSKPGTAVIRTIPNTPAAIGRGITVCVGNSAVGEDHRVACETLLSALGDVAWVEDEALIDAATAVSGSGPAYVFLLAECLADAARSLGLSDRLSAKLAEATVAGAGELMRQSQLPPGKLRENVTSPNGTTQAALDVLMAEDGLRPLLKAAVEAACRRSRELSR